MSFSEYLRHPSLLLAAVALAIGLVWFALGYPVQLARSPLTPGAKLDCVSYAPPATSSVQQIDRDVAGLARHTACLRTYTTTLDRVPEVALQSNLQVLQGLDIGRDSDRNNAEVERAVALEKAHRAAIRGFVVGSEVLSRNDLSAMELAVLIRRVRDATGLPVTYADRWEVWQNADALAGLVDFVTIHVDLYNADPPVAISDAARATAEARGRVAARVGAKEVLVGQVGWPSAGRMREWALPSPANHARVIQSVVAAGKAGNFRVNLFEGVDQHWRGRLAGTAAAHWGLLDAETGEIKFRWGGAVSNHPLWFYQGLLGVMLALVVFAAAFLAARSLGPHVPSRIDWRPIAVIALPAGLFIGWALAELPPQTDSVFEWAHATLLVGLAIATPAAAAAAVVHGKPMESFTALLDPDARRGTHALLQFVLLLFMVTVLVAIQIALGLVFDPLNRDLPGAVLTGPAVALLVLAFYRRPLARSPSIAETAAALVLAMSAVFIVFNETFWNWQALWLGLALSALAAACWLASGARVAQN
jgi:exo-beta-1,3-glucanase (GH17 family)